MRISDWSSDVCSSDLSKRVEHDEQRRPFMDHDRRADAEPHDCRGHEQGDDAEADDQILADDPTRTAAQSHSERQVRQIRSEEHTSELQSLMRNSYAVFCLKKKKYTEENTHNHSKQTNN